ncbi:MAG TPA: ABC transporter ATP-binding protein [candidate division Zixibacteria bacterium]|nr:ABC transporter ATP-binding protein [candidate division Zixibacteria bacterium]
MVDNDDNLAIDTHRLSKSYKDVDALRPLDLKVSRNSIFGFLGPNGAGKTTTIKLLLGLTRPTSGGGKVLGNDIGSESVKIRGKTGYLAQNPRYYEYMSARDTLRFRARFFYRGPKDQIEDRVAETLELVGLSDKADRPIKGFSGGELQRLGIAQAQVNYPALLILDEPAANLDPQGRRDVLEVMERLRRYSTIFYSTHILDDVQQVSDTVAIMNHGRLIAQEPLETLLAGSDGAVYTVTIKGDAEQARARVADQEWVSAVNVAGDDGHYQWQVSVVDEVVAETQLLRLILADEQLMVTGFGRKKYELEEIFMSLVEGDEDGER